MVFLSFDIESCTGNPLDGSLCSFGYILVKDGIVLDKDDLLCNPLPKAFTLGSFGKEPRLKLSYPIKHFRMQPRFNARYSAIKGLFDSADVVLGFAVHNDIKYINNACDKFSLNRIPFKFLDVQILMGLLIPELKNHGLKAAADRYGIEFLEHRSDEDARVTYEIFEKILEETGRSLDSVIDEFGIVLGVNGQDGHINCYSKWQISERVASNSKSSKKLLVNYYALRARERVKRKGKALQGKAVCLSESVYTQNMELARKIIVTVFSEGGEYDSSLLKCDIFVSLNSDKLTSRVQKINPNNCKIMSVSEFEKLCNGFDDYPFDDLKLMEEHYSSLISDRE